MVNKKIIICSLQNVSSWLLELPGDATLSYNTPDTVTTSFHFQSQPMHSCPPPWKLHPLPSLVVMVTTHGPQLAPVAVIRERPVSTGTGSVSLHSGKRTTCAVGVGEVVYLPHKITLCLHHRLETVLWHTLNQRL